MYVAFGRPKGHRGSYKVWEEGGVFPQVVFEIRSPGNRAGEMGRKLGFYDQYGAQEYYVYDPDRNVLEAYTRADGVLDLVPDPNGFVSPLLGIRFDTTGEQLVVYYPDGRPFLTFQEVVNQADDARRQAEREKQENDRLRAMLRAAGIDPDKPAG